jgi:uncharacterized protein
MLYKPYRALLAELFPHCKRVRKVPLNGGMTCPNLDGTRGTGGCDYCNNRSFSPVWDKARVEVLAQLEAGIAPLLARYPETGVLAYFQPYSNTYAPVDRLREIFSPALEHPAVVGIAVGTRPDCLPADVVDLLAELNRSKPVIVEIGMQTSNDATLARMNRGHSVAELCAAAARCKAAGLCITTHVIVGLPGDTSVDFMHSARLVGELGFSAVKIHPLHIVRGTRLADSFARGEFDLLGFEEYCAAVAAMICQLPAHVAVERFSGESPSDLLVAPAWSGERDRIIKEVERILQHKGWRGIEN